MLTLLARRTYDESNIEQQAISHMCLKDGDSTETKSLPEEPCLRIRTQVYFPSCWDGKNLDSDDHKSHVSSAFHLQVPGTRPNKPI